MARKTRAQALAEYLGFRLLVGLLRGLPEGAAYRLGENLGHLMYQVDRRHREVALDNLREALGADLADPELQVLARASFVHLGRTVVDTFRSPAPRPDLFDRVFAVEGREHFEEARRAGRGGLLITCHLGPWELLPLAAAVAGQPIAVVARPLDNPYLDAAVNALRARGGNRVISTRGLVREALAALGRGEFVGILIDQNVARDYGVFVEFFGRPACTATAPALLAIRSQAVVLPVAIIRRGEGRYQIQVQKPVEVIRTGNLQADVAVNTQAFTRAIETLIRQDPAQWLWVHRRWKTRPHD